MAAVSMSCGELLALASAAALGAAGFFAGTTATFCGRVASELLPKSGPAVVSLASLAV